MFLGMSRLSYSAPKNTRSVSALLWRLIAPMHSQPRIIEFTGQTIRLHVLNRQTAIIGNGVGSGDIQLFAAQLDKYVPTPWQWRFRRMPLRLRDFPHASELHFSLFDEHHTCGGRFHCTVGAFVAALVHHDFRVWGVLEQLHLPARKAWFRAECTSNSLD
jgi:hypothetical protein